MPEKKAAEVLDKPNDVIHGLFSRRAYGACDLVIIAPPLLEAEN
jgi:hypothetical protein